MSDSLRELFELVKSRKISSSENSYTCYLFSKGLDKILKKCGEECAETIIAAKNGDLVNTKDEICDLLYHLIVLMVELGIEFSEIEDVLRERAGKIGNLKQMRDTDKNS